MCKSAGFTLLELLVVIGILSLLLGLAVGYLGRSDPRMVAEAILRTELRAAQLTARAEGVPTEVLLRPGAEGQIATAQSRLLRPVVTFHFEPQEAFENEVLRPTLAGDDVPNGRFGHARRPPADGKEALLSWAVPPTVLDLREGFLVRLDLLLERRAASTVLRLPPAVELTLDADARPHARLYVHGLGGKQLVAVASELPLPLDRWCTIDVGCDSRTAWLSCDGRVLGQVVADGAPEQEEGGGRFEIAPAESPFAGIVDEVRWFAYAWSPLQHFPSGVQLDRVYRFAFDARGEATAQPEVKFGLPEEGS
jgi:prepilin-type N-terminal cleavage/methylation domain-containing protein